MELNKIEAKLEELEGTERIKRHFQLGQLGWDELTVEQKIERMRDIVKGITREQQRHWDLIEKLIDQMRLHSHSEGTGVLMPIDSGPHYPSPSMTPLPDGKVYF